MNKKFRFLSAALALALLTGCQSTAPSQSADVTPPPSTPVATTPTTPAESTPAEPIQFKLGTYACGDAYFSFYMDGVSGSLTDKDSGTGVAFIYEVEGDQVTFHIGSMDDSTVATMTVVDEDTFDVTWADGRQETMTYVYEVIPGLGDYDLGELGTGDGSVQFKLGNYLCGDVYYSFYMDGVSGSTSHKDSGTGFPFTYEVEGNQVTFHMGSMDDSTVATVIAVDEDTFDVTWADGRQETMTYVYEVIPELGNYE